jgi:hypothetical protein
MSRVRIRSDGAAMKTVDPTVYDLAASWLPEASQDTVQELAVMLQRDLEDFCEQYHAEQDAKADEMRSLRGYDPQEIAERF